MVDLDRTELIQNYKLGGELKDVLLSFQAVEVNEALDGFGCLYGEAVRENGNVVSIDFVFPFSELNTTGVIEMHVGGVKYVNKYE